MVNCAHPDHFAGELTGDWTSRISGVRANASRMSHGFKLIDAAEMKLMPLSWEQENPWSLDRLANYLHSL